MFGYTKMLIDLGVDQKQMDIITDSLNVIDVKTDSYYRKESSIHSYGVFAKKDIYKHEVIGLGSVDSMNKTFLGRYTNHSDINNTMFYYLANSNVVMVAEKDINKDEELLLNYRDHALQKVYL